MLRFSLVTPSFNQAAFLRAAIDSVRRQQGVELEYEVRDGGSTDGSLEVLREFGSSLRWRSGSDGGQVAAVNAGLQETRGEICGYLNSDDVLEPGALARVAAVFEENPDVDVVYGDAWFIDAEGRRTRPYPTAHFDFQVLVQHCFICQPATFWRRSLHTRWGWFDSAYDNTFDYEFWIRLATRGARFLHLPQALAESREHPDTKTRRQRKAIFREIRHMELRHLGYCGRNWWEQELRFYRDETDGWLSRLLPGKPEERLYGLAWWPYAFCRRRLGGPWRYRPGHWRA